MKIKVKNSFTWNKSEKNVFKMAYVFEGNQIIMFTFGNFLKT